ncbi:AlbA family DNA-binding domain-containing protein [Arthrobacter bambusae]
MIKQAVSDEVKERSDLDWKRELPQGNSEETRDEFTKDVAAMANSGGGTIVFGVEEDRATSAARTIVGASSWDDGRQRTLRTWAFNSIHPPVHGLEFTSVQEDGNEVIVLNVQASAETPHLIVKNGSFRSPRREGSATVYMSEREIESHYRLRFEDRRLRDKSLEDVTNQVLRGVPGDGRVWFVAAARPERLRAASAGRLRREEVAEIIAAVMRINPFRAPLMGVLGLEAASLNPRPRLRRWRSTGPDTHGVPDSVILEVHDDGCLALAVATHPEPDCDPGDVHVMDAEVFPAHAVHLVQAASSQLGLMADYALRINMFTRPQQDIFIRSFAAGTNNLEDRGPENSITHFEAVEGLVRAGADDSELLDEVRNLALDIVNQAGKMNLTTVYLKRPEPSTSI